MTELFQWFTDTSNAKTFVLVLFSITFVGILLYVYSNRGRTERFESYKNIPFQDDAEDNGHQKEVKDEH